MIGNMKRSTPWLPVIPILVAPFFLFAPVWLTGKALFWGTVSLQFVPWRAYAWEILRSGHLPLWNSLNGMGAPLLANYQSAFLYPPNWLLFVLQAIGGVEWAAWGQAVLVSAHLAWAGLGNARLARRLEMGGLSQTIAGLAYGLSTYLVSRAGFLSLCTAAAWLPWVILGVTNLRSISGEQADNKGLFRVNLRPVLVLTFYLAMQLLAGHAQITWYTWLLSFIWGGVWGWFLTERGSRVAETLGRLGLLTVALFLAVMLAAVQLFPTAEYLRESYRSNQVDFDFAMTYSFWPWRLLTLVAPNMFGNPAHGDYWGYGNYWEDAIYIGLLPLLMALTGAFGWVTHLKKDKRLRDSSHSKNGLVIIPLLSLLLVISFILALGRNTPIFPWLYRHVPTFDMFNAPTRFSLWGIFALALLAGYGIERWKRPTGRGLYWTRLAIAASVSVSLGAGLAGYLVKDIRPTFLSATAWAGVWGVGVGLLTLLAPVGNGQGGGNSAAINSRPLSHPIWSLLVTLFVAADLLWANWGLNPTIERSFYSERSSSEVAFRGRVYLPSKVEYGLKFDRFMRFDTFDPNEDWNDLRAVLLPNLNLLDGIASVNNFDPLLPGRYVRWMKGLEQIEGSRLHELLILMGVNYVVNIDETSPSGVRFDHLGIAKELRWVPCARMVGNGDKAWEMIFSGQVDFDKEVVIEQTASERIPDLGCAQARSDVDISEVSRYPDALRVKIRSMDEGWLVWSEVWYPGWRAFLDGEGVPILRANYLFQAVRVAPGEHEVFFVYRPTAFYAGAALSLLTMALLFVAWIKSKDSA